MVMADGFKDAVRELTGGRGVDIVVDPVGGDRVTDSLRSLAPGGRLLVVGFTAGDISTVKLNRLLLNNLDAVGWAGVHGRWRIRVIWPGSGRSCIACWRRAPLSRRSRKSIRCSGRRGDRGAGKPHREGQGCAQDARLTALA
ncbi:zinc-binding dehydrogenase family protein [Mycobacterium xenopi 4042]|uniref:Zinc-binding dehydrogenase family protein n=1 Tax=Mycobacterium xenopi 4042 TaxID=1299334 RepID=X7Z2P5_MYCXE|nr:zinc-binding dehydrogenase family protein [Mycobacterium xenopi 4042]